MKMLVDTNVLLRLLQPEHPQYLVLAQLLFLLNDRIRKQFDIARQ